MSRTFEHSRAIPVASDEAYQRVLTLPLPDLFGRRHLAIPPIREVRDQEGEWGRGGVGSSRAIVLGDGGTMRETLTTLDPPRAFAYRIDRITGPMKALVGSVEGTWSFAPAGTGTRIAWRWVVTPATPVGAAALPAFGRMWQGYARRAFEFLEDRLT